MSWRWISGSLLDSCGGGDANEGGEWLEGNQDDMEEENGDDMKEEHDDDMPPGLQISPGDTREGEEREERKEEEE